MVLAALCYGQLVCWGVTIYAFPILAASMAEEYHVPQASGTALISLALLAMACTVSTNVKLVQHLGPKFLIAGGVAIAISCLIGWALSQSFWVAAICWIGIGVAMSAILHENCFIIIHDKYGSGCLKPIALLTTVSAFASGIFIPVAIALVAKYGWRDTALLMALMLASYSIVAIKVLPRKLTAIPHADVQNGLGQKAAPESHTADRRGSRTLAFSFALHAMVASALWMSLVNLLNSKGLPLSTVAFIVAVIGPSQVLVRVIQYFSSDYVRPSSSGVIAFLALPTSMALLALGNSNSYVALLAFAVLFGSANGLVVMARGMAPVIFFPRNSYSAITGQIGKLVAIGRAVGPYAFALIIPVVGTAPSVLALACISLVAATLYLRHAPHVSH